MKEVSWNSKEGRDTLVNRIEKVLNTDWAVMRSKIPWEEAIEILEKNGFYTCRDHEKKIVNNRIGLATNGRGEFEALEPEIMVDLILYDLDINSPKKFQPVNMERGDGFWLDTYSEGEAKIEFALERMYLENLLMCSDSHSLRGIKLLTPEILYITNPITKKNYLDEDLLFRVQTYRPTEEVTRERNAKKLDKLLDNLGK